MYARFILKLWKWFGLLDIDICKSELFTISNFKVERFSCNLPILVLSTAYHLELPAYQKHPQTVQPQPVGSYWVVEVAVRTFHGRELALLRAQIPLPGRQ